MKQKNDMNEIELNGIFYVRKDLINEKAELRSNMPFVMVRTFSAGVHCGYLKEKNGRDVVLIDSIRIWKWSGAASLSQLSMEGINDAANCKFAMPVIQIILTEAIEIITMTEKARQSIIEVKSWKN